MFRLIQSFILDPQMSNENWSNWEQFMFPDSWIVSFYLEDIGAKMALYYNLTLHQKFVD